MTLGSAFLASAIKRFEDYKSLGNKTFLQLRDEYIHLQPNEVSNSIAVIIQHLHGNMLSYWKNFLTEDGENPWRKRDEEFEVHNLSKRELLALWEQGWNFFLYELRSLTEDDLLKTITIRQQPLTAVDAINRQLAHYSYHVGQIAYLGRWIRDTEWASLSIPKGESAAYYDKLLKS